MTPKFATPVGTKPVDLREIDKPRNTIIRLPNPPAEIDPSATPVTAGTGENEVRDGIIRLPSYLVREQRLQRLKERDLMTPAAKVVPA